MHKIFLLPETSDSLKNQNLKLADLDPRMRAAVSSWEAPHNPGYRVVFWNAVKIRTFLRKEYGARELEIFDALVPGAWKADFARYCILAKLGGWYADMQTVLLKPLREVYALSIVS